MDIQSANIIKFETGKIIMYPLRTIKDGGSYAIPPFIVKENIGYKEMALILKDTLELSDMGISPPREHETFFHKDNVKITGVKNTKMFHDKSLHVSVFTKDNQYHISPSINKGSRQGFTGIKGGRISISMDSSIEELASALEEAFDKSS